MEPEKPFACSMPECGMTFTNEDHLHVHTKKHDMVLQLGMEQKAAFVADQTPTPTRFIRNCEEVGLFQDLQNVNPFDETFKRAMETKHGLLSLEGPSSTEDALHTPHLVFPLESGDCTLYTANNQRNITISRSSSDESGAVKEYETTTISKLTNEVTTISRVVKDVPDKSNDEDKTTKKDIVNETVSYRNNVIKIQSNVEIRKDNLLSVENNKKDLPPIMSQKSLDFVVDSLTSDVHSEKNDKTDKHHDNNKDGNSKDDFKLEECEVVIMLPNGKNVRMKAVEELNSKLDAKEKLKKVIENKERAKEKDKIDKIPNNAIPNVIPLSTGTLIPVTLLSPQTPVVKTAPKLPLAPIFRDDTSKRKPNKMCEDRNVSVINNGDNVINKNETKRQKLNDGRSAASRRYREKVKQTMEQQREENKHLRTQNQQLSAEKAVLQTIIKAHLTKCPIANELRNIIQKASHKIKDPGTNTYRC